MHAQAALESRVRDDKVPARMRQLREYNGDKLIVAFDPEGEGTVALELAYSLGSARLYLVLYAAVFLVVILLLPRGIIPSLADRVA